jgi:hypothetical protein
MTTKVSYGVANIASQAEAEAGTAADKFMTPERVNQAVAARVLYGFYTTRNAVDTASDVDISAGACWDTTRSVWIEGSAMTKQLDAAWAAGTNAGMLDTGAVSFSEGYHIYAMINDVDGSVDYLASLQSTWSAVSPKPTNYTKGQIIGYMYRGASEIEPNIWTGNYCEYAGTGVYPTAFTDGPGTSSGMVAYEVKQVAHNSLATLSALSTDISSTNTAMRIYIMYYDGVTLSTIFNSSTAVEFSQLNTATNYYIRGYGTTNVTVGPTREVQANQLDASNGATLTCYVRGFWLKDRLEATS